MEDQEPDPTLEERRNRYEEKLDNKRERLLERADKADREGDARIKRADSDASAIPMGQPILVGHHSEKRDRNFRNRIHNNYSKGYQLKEKAGNLRARAASVGTAGVSSDDPDAVVKLEETARRARKEAGVQQGDQQGPEGRPTGPAAMKLSSSSDSERLSSPSSRSRTTPADV